MAGIGDTGITVAKFAASFVTLKANFDRKDDGAAASSLEKLKKELIFLPTFLDPSVKSPSKLQEWMLARETLEHACLLSVRQKDMAALELYFQQVRVYYFDMIDPQFQQSSILYLIIGLNLLRLLVQSRVAEFHTELERIPNAEHGNMYVRFAVMMERYLMEGSYNKLLHARSQAPSNEYVSIVELLEMTVRSEAATCIPCAYPSIGLSQAQKMLMLSSSGDVQAYGKKYTWPLSTDGQRFVFVKTEDQAAGKREMPFLETLKHHIQFAAELQRVV